MLYKDLGMISTVLDERRLPSLRGQLAIAHCRYSTTGSTIWENAQPTYRLGPRRALAIGHNGNLVNTRELLDQLRGGRARLPASTDTELLTALLADEPAADTVEALARSCRASAARSAWSILDERRVIGVRDPFGFRPLVLGRLPRTADAASADDGLWRGDDADAGWCLSSETAGLDIVGAEYVRDVEPGEIVILEPGQAPRSVRFAEATPALCVFELIYFARPDSYMEGRNLYEARRRMGDAAGAGAPGRRRPRDARAGHRRPGRGRLRRGIGPAVPRGDVPQPLRRADVHPAVGRAAPPRRHDQAQPAARGRQRQAPHRRRRLDRARDDDQADRRAAAQGRRRPRSTSGSARRRSTTRASTASTRQIETELIAATHTEPEIREFIGADSLGYLSIRGVLAALDLPYERFCFACFDGNYPEPVPYDAASRKFILEEPVPAAGAVTGGEAAAPRIAAAGVDVAAGERAVDLMRGARRVDPAAGGASAASAGSAARSRIPAGYREPLLVASTDGVGTKTAIAAALGRFDTIGIDLVAMCADDVVCCGRRAARLPRLRGGRPARTRVGVAELVGWRRRRLPRGGLRARRRRDGRAPGAHGAPTRSTWPAAASASSSAPT